MSSLTCRHCGGECINHEQPIQLRDDSGAWVVVGHIPLRTCTNPACPLFNHTVNHANINLADYGATDRPGWRA